MKGKDLPPFLLFIAHLFLLSLVIFHFKFLLLRFSFLLPGGLLFFRWYCGKNRGDLKSRGQAWEKTGDSKILSYDSQKKKEYLKFYLIESGTKTMSLKFEGNNPGKKRNV
jgi:hypothetical protein